MKLNHKIRTGVTLFTYFTGLLGCSLISSYNKDLSTAMVLIIFLSTYVALLTENKGETKK